MVIGSPVSVANVAGMNIAVAGQSTPAFNDEARMPAPYSPVSKYVRVYHPYAESIYGTNISER